MESQFLDMLKRNDKSLLEFTTLNGAKIYGICNPKKTSIHQIIKTTFDNYSINNNEAQLSLVINTGNRNMTHLYKDDQRALSDLLDQIPNNTNEESGSKIDKICMKIVELTNDFCVNNDYESTVNFSEYEETFLLSTLSGRILPIPYKPEATVFDIKCFIRNEEGIPLNQQRLIYSGNQLQDENLITDYKIVPGCKIHLVLRMRGGMYHETSGRNGNYGSLKNIMFNIKSDL
jgi:hypothetical protein